MHRPFCTHPHNYTQSGNRNKWNVPTILLFRAYLSLAATVQPLSSLRPEILVAVRHTLLNYMNAVKSGRNKRCSKQTTAFCRTGNAITASHWLSRSVVLSCSVLISVPVYHAGLLFYSTTDAQVPPKRQSLPGQATRPYMPEDGKKVKCTLVQALRLCTGRTVHRGSRGIALLFHDIGTRRG